VAAELESLESKPPETSERAEQRRCRGGGEIEIESGGDLDEVERDVGVVVERGPLERVVAVAVGLPERGGGAPALHEFPQPLEIPVRGRRVHVHHGVRLRHRGPAPPPPLRLLVLNLPPRAVGHHLDLRHGGRREGAKGRGERS